MRGLVALVLAVWAAAEHLHLIGDDFGDVAVLAVAILVLAGLDLAFDIDLLAFVQVFAADIGEAAPGDDVVPFGALLRLAVAVFELFAGGQREGGDGGAGGRVAQLGVFSEIADQDDFVD